jgi:hypothetical protein
MKYIHINLPDDYNSVKQIQRGETIFINDNYKYNNEETETIFLQLRSQSASQVSQG